MLKNIKLSFIFFSMLLIFCGCKSDKNTDNLNTDIYKNVIINLEKIGELKLVETEKKYIGRILFFRHDEYEDNFIIVDNIFKDIKIVNKKGKIEKVLGRFGSGPGEFQRIARIAYDKKYYYMADDVLYRISKFSKDSGYVNSFKIPSEIWFDGRSMKIYNDKIFLSSYERKYKPGFEDYKAKPVAVLDKEGNILYYLGRYDDIYKKLRIYGTSPCFDIDKSGFVYITNEQSWKIFKYDIEGKYIKTFGVKGEKFLEQKESIRGDESYEEINKLSLITSTVQEFYVSDYIYLQYTNNSEEFIKSRSRLDQDHYLMVYTKEGKCIKSDIKLPGGGMKYVDNNGIIYIELSDEPGNRIIGKYKIKIEKEG